MAESPTNTNDDGEEVHKENPTPPEPPPSPEKVGFGSVAKERTPPPPANLSKTDRDKLLLAASDIIEFGIPVEQAASLHGIAPDKVQRWYQDYLQSTGKEGLPVPPEGNDGSIPSTPPPVKIQSASRFSGWMRDVPAGIKRRLWPIACVLAALILIFKVIGNSRGPSTAVADPGKDGGGSRQTGNPQTGGTPTKWNSGDTNSQAELLERIPPWLEQFASCETWQERLQYVRHPKRVEPLMADYYQKNPDGPMDAIEIDSAVSFVRRTDGQFALANGSRVRPDQPPIPVVFLIKILGDGTDFRVDWELLVNYEPKPWEEFKSEKTTEPFPFRVRISEGDYYNTPFMDKEKYASFKMQVLGRDGGSLYGFAKIGSDEATRLKQTLARRISGKRAMILRLRYPENAQADDLLEIDSIAADRW